MLEAIGVLPEDEAIYRSLLTRSQAEVGELAASSGRNAQSVRASLTNLENLGLVSRLPGRTHRVRAARPDVAIDVLVNRRQEALARTQLAARELLADMPPEERYRPEELVEIVVGRTAIAARFDQLLENTRDELLVLDRPPYVADTHQSDHSVRSLLRQDVSVRGIYAPEALELPGALEAVQDAVSVGEESRMHASVPMKLAIGDRKLAILPVGVDAAADAALCIRPSALLDALTQLFDLMWEQATPITRTAVATTPTDQDIASLLAVGAKDDVIARHLGISSRTLSRRISELLDHLHVRTRFQAGVQAVRIGWLPPLEHGKGSDDGLIQD